MLHTKYHEVEKLNTALNIKWWHKKDTWRSFHVICVPADVSQGIVRGHSSLNVPV